MAEVYGMMKTMLDAHTMGVHAATALLRDCGFTVEVAPPIVQHALDGISAESNQQIVVNWIKVKKIKTTCTQTPFYAT